MTAALNKGPEAHEGIHRQLEQEKRKLQNLISAIEGGSDAPSALLKAVAEREAAIKRLEKELKRAEDKPSGQTTLPDLHVWVEQQLQNITEVLKTDAAKTKAEFRRLNLQLTFSPVEAKPRAHFVVTGQCDLSALAFFYLRSKSGALLDRTLVLPRRIESWSLTSLQQRLVKTGGRRGDPARRTFGQEKSSGCRMWPTFGTKSEMSDKCACRRTLRLETINRSP